MAEQGWYLVLIVAVAVVGLALIFRRGRLRTSVEGFGMRADVEGSGPDGGKATPASPPAPPGLSASDGGIVVGRDATGNFNTGSRARVGDERKR